MNKKLKIVKVDSKYCDYLRKYDDKVCYNAGYKELRPFIGVLFTIDNCQYFAPLSSPKPKHLKIKGNVDFLKLDGGRLGAINFNNMLPVTNNNIVKIDLDKQCSTKSEERYMKLLKKQIYWLNRNSDKLYNKSKKLYDKYISGTLDENIVARCCNFKLLEEKCIEYNKELVNI